MSSPRRVVDGLDARSTSTSSLAPSPICRVSMRTPRVAERAASAWPDPVVSLPSESRTIRFCASSGNSAVASRSAPPMSLAERTGAEAIRSISARSLGRRSTSASLPNATMPATSPSGISSSAPRTNASASSRPALPIESDRSTTNTVARRLTGSTICSPARPRTSAASSIERRTSATRRLPAPTRRRAATWRITVSRNAGMNSRSASGASNARPI